MKKLMNRLVVSTATASGLLLASGTALAVQLRVPDQFVTVQSAIDAAQSGDEIVLGPGTYTEAIQVIGKSLTIRSLSNNPDDTVIRWPFGQVFRVESSPQLRLQEITIRDGIGASAAVCGSAGLTKFAGGMIARDSGVELIGCVMSNNTGEIGGAIFASGGSFTIRRSTFEGNGVNPAPGQTASVGAVFRNCDRGAPTPLLIEDSVFINNGDVSGALPVVSPINGATVVRRSRFENNRGGIIEPTGGTNVTIESSLFMMNRGIRSVVGTALSNPDAEVRIRESTFVGNSSDVLAAMPSGETLLEITGTKFINTVDSAIFYYQQPGGTAIIDRCEIRGSGSTGIATVADTGVTRISNTLIAGVAGDALLISNPSNPATTTIENCTIVASGGIGVRTDALLVGTLNVNNSIVWGNAGGQIGRPLIPIGQTITASSSIIQGGYAGTGNLSSDPRFVAATGASGDYRILSDSPAIDAGNNTLITPLSTPERDLDNAPRRVDVTARPDTGIGGAPVVDIGAYEAREPATVCRADFDGSSIVNLDDLFLFLGAWFANDPRTDVDNSGTRGLDDIFVYLNLWFAGC